MTFLDPVTKQQRPNPLVAALTAPSRLTSAIGGFGVSAPPLDVNLPRNLASLSNKYTQLDQVLAQLPPGVANALRDLDAGRVASGSAPTTMTQTPGMLQTALTNKQATPQPDRNPWNVVGNIRSDLSDILKSVPRLPLAALHEVRDVGNIGGYISDAREAGTNPLTALLQAPGVRMIPGSYVLGNVADGRGGLQELATHPLMAALDVLPVANRAAASTNVGRAATELAEAAGRRPRPLSAVLTQSLDSNGTLQRGRLGPLVDTVRNDTRLGQALDAFGGSRSRDVARARGSLEQRYRSLLLGQGVPSTTVETFLPRVHDIFTRYSDEYPMFKQSKAAAGPEFDAARAEFYRDLQRTPDKYNPALVNEIRDLNFDMAKFQQSQGNLGMFDDEWYDTTTANRLNKSQGRVDHAQRMTSLRNEYLSPSGQFTTDQFRAALEDLRGSTGKQRSQLAGALESTLDAYGYDLTNLKGRGSDSWATSVDTLLSDPAFTPTPRASLADVTRTLRARAGDRQATLLEAAVANGQRGEVSKRLGIIERRAGGGGFDAGFADDVKSLSRRYQFEDKTGRQFTDSRLSRRQRAFDRTRSQAAPARFQALIGDQVQAEAGIKLRGEAERTLGRQLSPDEAGQLVASIENRVWQNVPGLDSATAADMVKTVEREVAATWRELRAAGHDPVFVHKVSPARANQALAGNIGPIPTKQSATKERALDLSPGVNDVQVSLTHQAGEMLQQRYNEMFVDDVISRVGKSEADLRAEVLPEAQRRALRDPALDVEGHIFKQMDRGWTKFNPDEAGTAWGGVRLDKYRQDAWYIPKSVADNLHRYAKPPSILSSITDPLTKAFRYNVIGLSPSIIINNFFSNSVAMMAESGPRPFKHFAEARRWLADPSMIPDEQLKAMIVAEIPNMEQLGTDAWLKSRTGGKFMAGFNAGNAFKDSVMARTAGTAKQKLDAVVSKSLEVQRWSDNIYRAMQYMDEVEKGAKKGKTVAESSHAAMEMVRRTFVDYTSFTPIERSAMRTIIPFYSYMGHAARFIARYPLDHPLRASITSSLAQAERERLGALPGSFLSMIPLGGIDDMGKQTFGALRPFDPFGDMSDLLSVSGWMASLNPALTTILQQVGVVRGSAELYPTMRYDPQSGRMVAVHGNFLTDLVNNTLPRAGLLTAAVGLNPQFSQTKDPAAKLRSMLSMAGLPRAWREFNVPQEQMRAELNRQRATTDVRNDALSSGNWREALRYPTLRAFYDAVQKLPPDVIASMAPTTRNAVMQQLATVQPVGAYPGVGGNDDS